MIAFLRGRVHDKQPNRVIVDVGGVGYDVHVPLSTFYNLGDEGAEVSLRVHTHVREDALQLYGFLTELERQLFERLIAISGIGPKLAIVVLSGMEPRDLVAAVQRADVARLTTIPGIGKKTAERIVLELKDRLDSDRRARCTRRRGACIVGGPASSRPALGAAQPRLSSAAGREGHRHDSDVESGRLFRARGPDSAPRADAVSDCAATSRRAVNAAEHLDAEIAEHAAVAARYARRGGDGVFPARDGVCARTAIGPQAPPLRQRRSRGGRSAHRD